MKYGIIAVLVIFSSIMLYSQDNPEKKVNHVIEFIQQNSSNYFNTEETTLKTIFKLDVISYFNLNEQYNTPLQIKHFQTTPEYTTKLNELKTLRQTKSQEWHCFILEARNKSIKYSIPRKRLEQIADDCRIDPAGYFIIWSCAFKKLPILRVHARPFYSQAPAAYDNYLYYPVDEKTALKVENNIQDVKTYIFYKISDVKHFRFQEYCPPDACWRAQEEDSFIVSNVRIVIINSSTDEVYFDMNY